MSSATITAGIRRRKAQTATALGLAERWQTPDGPGELDAADRGPHSAPFCRSAYRDRWPTSGNRITAGPLRATWSGVIQFGLVAMLI
ncbi:hypothetical protein QFZ82_007646 [Streptomyces sp. V4I23]|nr:hypothetical protein [Streptomyces sp. V4I23]